jgi:tRNA(fMet)-specific endonuclease VapC
MGMILDSSVLIAAERKRFDLVGFLSAHPNETFFITAITASELLHGCARAIDLAIRERRIRFVEGLLQDYVALPFALAEARTHAGLWVELERKGILIGERDLLIAAIAKANGHTIATANRDEFARVPGLALEEVEPFVLKPA